jgi:hypothetical protein
MSSRASARNVNVGGSAMRHPGAVIRSVGCIVAIVLRDRGMQRDVGPRRAAGLRDALGAREARGVSYRDRARCGMGDKHGCDGVRVRNGYVSVLAYREAARERISIRCAQRDAGANRAKCGTIITRASLDYAAIPKT